MHQLKRHVVMPGVASEDRSNTWRGLGPSSLYQMYYTGTVELE